MHFELAGHRHDPALRALLREHAMPGWVELALEREPDFFAAAAATGGLSQTVVALENDTVVGMGCRSVREVYLNGRAASLGYLSGLRLRQPFRGGNLSEPGLHFGNHRFAARKEFGKFHPCFGRIRMEGKHPHDEFYSVFQTQAVGTHGTEVTPRSDVIEKNFHDGRCAHGVSPL